MIGTAFALCGCAGAPVDGLQNIETIVVIYAENRSFDHLYGLFPGAEGIAQATPEQKTQLDHDGNPLPHLPPVWGAGGRPDSRLLTFGLPNGPFRLDAAPINRKWDEVLPSPWHLYYQNIEQINGGRNNLFVAMSNAGAWVMAHVDGSQMRMWKWAQDYTLADHFFMGAFGGSYLNHQWLICACTPRDPGAPDDAKAVLEGSKLKKKPSSPASVLQGPVEVMDGRLTPDAYIVDTSQSVPPLKEKTIGDTLSAKGISWAWYTGGNFQPHHQPFNYYARFAPGTAGRAAYLKDYDELAADIDKGALPHVVFYKPAGYTDLASGDEHLDGLLNRLKSSQQWPHMAIIVTYDDNGGFWDHMPPPAGPGWGDRWGPGTRIPAIVVSPFAKRGNVDKTVYDTTSILKLITRRFGLEPLPGVRENMGDLSNAFTY